MTTQQTGQLDTDQVKIEILAPSPVLAMAGVGGKDLQNKPLNSNSMSAVVSIIHKGHRVAILPGDIDEVGLSNLADGHEDLYADLLVFPHHGGRSGNADGEQFAQSLCSLVKPKVVLFSFDRNRFSNPRKESYRWARLGLSLTLLADLFADTNSAPDCSWHR